MGQKYLLRIGLIPYSGVLLSLASPLHQFQFLFYVYLNGFLSRFDPSSFLGGWAGSIFGSVFSLFGFGGAGPVAGGDHGNGASGGGAAVTTGILGGLGAEGGGLGGSFSKSRINAMHQAIVTQQCNRVGNHGLLLLTLEYRKKEIKKVLQMIASERAAMAFQCSCGIGATGLISALILLALGVAEEDVVYTFEVGGSVDGGRGAHV